MIINLKKTLLKIVLCAFASGIYLNSSTAQKLEGGIMIGASNYYGDLSNGTVMLSQTHPSAGILVRYHLSERWALKGFFGYGRVSGIDSLSNDAGRQKRNLSFYSDVFEVSGQVELNLIRYNQRYYAKKPFIPYLFVGIGVYNFNPKAIYQGKTYELQPLGTEGQGTTQYNDREKYALTQICIPFGFGIKKKIATRWSIGFEIGVRYLYTNYFDDVNGTYASNSVIERAYGPIAAALADRSAEKGDGTPQFSEGSKRGSDKLTKNDLYIIAGFSILYTLKNPVTCPKF